MRRRSHRGTVSDPSPPLDGVYIQRSYSGIDPLDRAIEGKSFRVWRREVDSDGDSYLLLGDDETMAYEDQLDVRFVAEPAGPEMAIRAHQSSARRNRIPPPTLQSLEVQNHQRHVG